MKINEIITEGEVIPLGKKHRGDLAGTHSCSKCGGDLQGGTYMGHRVKVCVPCKQVYLPPNSGIDQQGNKIEEQGVEEGKTGPGLWANINAKRERGAKMRKKGAPGAPTEKALKAAQAGSKNESVSEGSDPCWDNYKQVGMKKKGGRKVPNCVPKEGVAEGSNGEYDDESGMAETNLHTIARAAKGLLDTIDDNENLPEWVQEKIAKVEGMMVTAWDYLKSQEEQGIDPRQGVAGSQLEETYHDDDEFFEAYGVMEYNEGMINEAEYQGRKVTLNKPMQGDSKKFKVFVKNEKGNVVKVNFGQKGARIKKNNPGRRKNFRARHNCDNPGPKTGARYWSCRKW